MSMVHPRRPRLGSWRALFVGLDVRPVGGKKSAPGIGPTVVRAPAAWGCNACGQGHGAMRNADPAGS